MLLTECLGPNSEDIIDDGQLDHCNNSSSSILPALLLTLSFRIKTEGYIIKSYQPIEYISCFLFLMFLLHIRLIFCGYGVYA